MASNNIARLGVVLGIDTASFAADVDKTVAETRKLAAAVKRDSNAAAGEIINLIHATEDYGKTLTKVQQIQREIDSGRFMGAEDTYKKQLLERAAAYDLIASSQKKVTTGMNEQQKLSLTYQTTDLFTQLASGGNPLIALIQQGGQLKDSMGGLGNMFRMLATFITPVAVAVSTLAVSIGSIAVAFYQGSEESKKFLNSLALTNGFAGITLASFNNLATTISTKFNVGMGEARDIFQNLSSSGNFTYKSLDSVAGVIARISKISGENATVVASQLIPSLDGSASSAKKLNEQYHFLTLEQYKQIEALQKHGQIQEAIKLTTDLLNTSLEGQGAKLNFIGKMWEYSKQKASEYWDWAKNIGREEDPAMKALKNQAGLLEKAMPNVKALGQKRIDELLDEYKRLAAVVDQQEAEAKSKADKKAKDALGINDYSATGGVDTQRKLAIENEKIKYHAAIEAAKVTATEEQRIGLDASVQMMDKIYEYRMHSEQDFRANGGQLQKNMLAEIGAITAERDRKISDQKYKEYQKELDVQIQAMRNEEAFIAKRDASQIAYVEKNWLAYKAIEETQKAERETLQFKMETFGYTQKELDLKKVDIELSKQKALIAANSTGQTESDIAEAYRLADAIAFQKKETIDLADVYRKTDLNFQSVWGNMSSAIDNFVKTGKFSFKDFARSVIQDLIAIQMKAAALKFLGGVFNMFDGGGLGNGASGSGTGVQGFGSAYADGGSPTPNTVNLVGERGPELFIPKTAGTIIPNGALSSMGGTSNVTNYNINAIDTKSFEERILGSSTAVWAANQYGAKSLATTTGRT